jgi:hypothetical protein
VRPAGDAKAFVPSASEYILENFEANDRIAMLVLNRHSKETIQRITTAQKAASPEFQSWLRFKNASGADIYIGMNPLRQDASTRTKKDIKTIRHLYLDLDQGGQQALNSIESSTLLPKPNYVLTSSPGKFQLVWKVEGISLEEAEELLHRMAREFSGDPAATDATRVMRLPGFANKKYGSDFYVKIRRESTETHHLRDFQLPIDARDTQHQNYGTRTKRDVLTRSVLSQSEYDWAFAKRALSRGEDPEEVIRKIAEFRGSDKSNPTGYAWRTVTKAQAELADSQSRSGHDSSSDSSIPGNPARTD